MHTRVLAPWAAVALVIVFGLCVPVRAGQALSGTTALDPATTNTGAAISAATGAARDATRVDPQTIYNIFKASSVLSMTPTYGSSWLNAAQVLSPRLLRVGAQRDC